MAYYNPYITGQYNPLYNPTNQAFFHGSGGFSSQKSHWKSPLEPLEPFQQVTKTGKMKQRLGNHEMLSPKVVIHEFLRVLVPFLLNKNHKKLRIPSRGDIFNFDSFATQWNPSSREKNHGHLHTFHLPAGSKISKNLYQGAKIDIFPSQRTWSK